MDINELIFGKEFAEKEGEFNESLNRIEEKYIDFFKSRVSKFKTDKHDRLHNHWMMIGNNFSVQFGFEIDSEIPEEIRNECYSEFRRIFIHNK